MDIEALKSKPERFLNREISWLAFNRRVLEEANNLLHPLFERVRFTSICARNMDEFYMVRVGGLRGQVNAGISERSADGRTPQQQLDEIHTHAVSFAEDMQRTWRDLVTELDQNGIKILSYDQLSKDEHAWLLDKFENEIQPLLTPIAMDPSHPFPFIPNMGLSVIVNLEDNKDKKALNVLIQIPGSLERFVRLPGDKPRYMLLEKIVMRHLDKIFPGMNILTYNTFRIMRDSEIEIQEEAEDLVLIFENALKRRRRGNVIQMSVHHSIDKKTLHFLTAHLKLQQEQVRLVNGLVGLADCEEIITDEFPEFLFKPYHARFPERIRDFGGDCFAAIKQKDIIVHHPYESFDVVVQFLRQAAADKDVVSIKQTLYRTSDGSPIVKALVEAAESGKSVTALVELKARFDEEANIKWARDMERAGVQVVYGFMDLKTHAKVSLVVRREGKSLQSYAHFGTGNYHAINARVYTDLSYFTCDKDLCRDASLMFNYMTGYAQPKDLQKLRISPLNMRTTLEDMIDAEIAYAKAGRPAHIWAKCNSLLDPALIDKLYEASQAGVQIELVVRGICSLRPGIPDLSENIRVKSIIGRFLEHERIYCFGNGEALPSRAAKVFMSSADLMPRNLDRRIEALVPITNETVHKQILDQIMVANLKDRKYSWVMNTDGTYKRTKFDENSFSAHDYFMNNPSLSGRGKALIEAPMPPSLKLSETQDSTDA